MSKIAVSGSASGTGTFTIKSPATNADRVFNLPDEAGTVLTDVSDIEPQVKTATNATGSAPIYACRAWVNFNGQGTVAIRDSGNVSSITDNGSGNFTVNFTTAMPDANYSASLASSGVGDRRALGASRSDFDHTTTSMRVFQERDNDNSRLDAININVAIFR